MGTVDVLNTILLLIPGYAGAWLMGLSVGVRRREWQQMVLYSLVFSALAYLMLLKIFPMVHGFVDSGYTESIQRSLNNVAKIGKVEKVLAFSDAVNLLPLALGASTVLGVLLGKLRTAQWYKGLIRVAFHRTVNIDVWDDFHELDPRTPSLITLKDGNAVAGTIWKTSDTLVGNDRGIIIRDPKLYLDYTKRFLTGDPDVCVDLPGETLIFTPFRGWDSGPG